MKVYIDHRVYEVMQNFYDISIDLHPSLDYETISRKIVRLEQAMYDFAKHALIFHKDPYRRDWKENGYYEFEHEDFHFAYRVYISESGELVVRYHDAVHSLLNHNPEEGFDIEQ